jgi:hypothetical protein
MMSAIDRLQFVTMVGLIRETERALDDGIKAPQRDPARSGTDTPM